MKGQAHSQKLQLGGSFVQNCGTFQQNTGQKFVIFSNKIVDLFGGPLFQTGVLLHLENPPWLWA